MKKIYFFSAKITLLLFSATVFFSCKHAADETGGDVATTKTPVTITHFSIGNLTETLELHGTSAYTKDNIVKASVSGYLKNVNVSIGDFVEKGKILFTVQTKESAAMDNSKFKDTLYHFSGIINMEASTSGVVTGLNYQKGDYVMEGDSLCTISLQNSFAFLLQVPFEDNEYARVGSSCTIVLADKKEIPGIISAKLSSVDAASQTQTYLVKPSSSVSLPENLLVTIVLIKSVKSTAHTLPKEAVLSDETQENFWVMKMINDTTAIKTSIEKGMETKDEVEIISPDFSVDDKILLTGNYGLADTATVSIIK